MPADPPPSYVPSMDDESFEVHPVRARDILLGSGPRFARDAMGPMLAFYVGWRLVGLPAGIALATLAATASYRWERQHHRTGLMARIGLGLALLQAVIGLTSGSEQLYLAQPVIINGLYGLAFVGSVAIGRPLAGAFADEMYPFPDEVREVGDLPPGLRPRLARVGRVPPRPQRLPPGHPPGGLRRSVPRRQRGHRPAPDGALLAWSTWYGVRGFRTSEEWRPAIRAEERATHR